MGIRHRVGRAIMGRGEQDRIERSMQLLHEAYLDGPYHITPSLLHHRLSEIDAQSIDLYISQLGFDIIGGGLAGYGDDNEQERIRSVSEARRLFKYDPLTQWGIWTWTNYGFGEKIDIMPEDETAQKDFNEFWTADRNSGVLGDSELARLSNDVLADGEIFLVYFVSAVDGKSTIRTIPTEEIKAIVTDPQDASTKLFYKREWQEGTERKEAYYPDWRAFYAEGQSPLDNVELPKGIARYDEPDDLGTYAVIQHVAHNLKRPRRDVTSTLSMRGWPISTSSAPWSRVHKSFREDRATVASAVAMYVHKLKHKQGSRATADARSQLASTLQTLSGASYEGNPPAAAGSTWIENEAVDLTKLPLTTGAGDAKIDGESLFLMANLGMGLFPHYAGSGDAYRLATATAMERPLEMQWSRYQLFWSSQFKTMVRIVLLGYERSDAGAHQYDSYAAQVSTDRLVEVDLVMMADSLTKLYNGTITPLVNAGIIPDDTAARIAAGIWRIVLQAVGVAEPQVVASDEVFGAEPIEETDYTPLFISESHAATEVRRRCPLDDCDGDLSHAYEGHSGLLVCATCKRTYDPGVE